MALMHLYCVMVCVNSLLETLASKYNQPGCCSSAGKRIKRQIYSLTSHLNGTTHTVSAKCGGFGFSDVTTQLESFNTYSEWNLHRIVQQI